MEQGGLPVCWAQDRSGGGGAAVAELQVKDFRSGLKPGGLLAIIDCEATPGEVPESYVRHHRVPSASVRNEAARNGFRFLRSELGFVDPATPFSYWFFLVFERPL